KLSSSDLHSRLKTRKVLGVGETDDGDVHRSKLSQILGHSDQLYVRLPWGLRAWQFILALSFTVVSLWALIMPSQLFDVTFETDEALSLFHWNSLNVSDRDVIRAALLSSIVYFMLQIIATVSLYDIRVLLDVSSSHSVYCYVSVAMCLSVCTVAALSSVPMREILPLNAMLCHVARLGAAGLSGFLYWTLSLTFCSVVTWDGIKQNASWLQAFRLTSALISTLFYHVVGCKTVSLKKQPQPNKDSSE
ncbi:hypothetical protein BaRGS_00022385, partial [Batillaria attramentaria]